jgi:hypothetical protein
VTAAEREEREDQPDGRAVVRLQRGRRSAVAVKWGQPHQVLIEHVRDGEDAGAVQRRGKPDLKQY